MFIDPRISRRRVMMLTGAAMPLALAACGGGTPVVPVVSGGPPSPPPNTDLISDAGSILDKVDTIRQTLSADVQAIVDKGKALLDSFKASGSTGTASTLISTIASLASYLPAPYGTIALAIKTLVPVMAGVIGIRMATAPTGMSVAQARQVLATR